MIKFGAVHDGVEVPHVYPDIWARESTSSGGQRLVIAPSRDHLGLMLRLARAWLGDFHVLYVLLVARSDAQPGRYQSPTPLSYDELEDFLRRYAAFLATDGRHHLWIGSTEEDGTLVYDQHNVIYAYGALDEYIDLLSDEGFHEAPVDFPMPHCHFYNAANDAVERELFAHWAWVRHPLRPVDGCTAD
jgi:hypothetical protein